MLVLVGTRTRVVDNSGGSVGECVEIYNASKYYGARAGHAILVALKRVFANKKIKQGDLTKAVVVRSRDHFRRYSGHRIRVNNTGIVLVNNTTLMPRAKRARSLMLEEVRYNVIAGIKLLSIAPIVL